MVVNQANQKYEYLEVTYAIGAAVMATEASEYRGLYGTITEIRDGSDRETENDTPDIVHASAQRNAAHIAKEDKNNLISTTHSIP